MVILGYCIGAVLHIIVKVLGYVGAHREQTLKTYCATYGPLVAKGAVFDVVILAFWKIGILPYLAGMIGLSVPAGYVIPEGVEIWAGIASGYAADSIGKTFMGALERFYSKSMSTLGGGAK